MSRAAMRRLDKLEASQGAKGAAMVLIYSHDYRGFQEQRRSLLEAGRIREEDWCLWERPEGDEPGSPEIIASSMSHEDWVEFLTREEEPA